MPSKSVVRLTDRPDMTLDVYRGRKTTTQQQQQLALAKAHARTQSTPKGVCMNQRVKIAHTR